MPPSHASGVAAAVRSSVAPALRSYQTEAVRDIYTSWMLARRVLLVLPTGAGKCLGKGTPVLKWDGTIVPVEDVRVGDLLMGPDSTPRTVLSLARGREELYRVVPTKGDSYVVNASHILSLKRTGEKRHPKYPCQRNAGEVVNMEARDFIAKSKWFRHVHKGWRTGVNFPAGRRAPFDPYLLGLWLGDGNSRGMSFCIGDPETAQAVLQWADEKGRTVRVEKNSSGSVMLHVRGARHILRESNLWMNKHIPHGALTASRADRLALLAGLIDSDGARSRGGFDVVFKDRNLAEQTAFLARSLHLAAYVTECERTRTNNGVRGTYFRISISGDCSIVPVRVPRKKCPPRKQVKDVLRTGLTLEPLGEGDYYGFEISGDRLFMLGDFTVTHNTVTLAHIVSNHTGPALVGAHRKELLDQLSVALARVGVRHRIIAPDATIRAICAKHVEEMGVSYYDANAQVAVASVDALGSKATQAVHGKFLARVTLWVMDEAHHVLKKNKWGRGLALLNPDAYGLGVTATPCRADGMGLGSVADGVFDTMVVGPTMRSLIKWGFLTDADVVAPQTDVDWAAASVSAGGDLVLDRGAGKAAVRASGIVGDTVANYQRFAAGKLAVVFASDIDTAGDIAERFRAAGIPAQAVDGTTPGGIRDDIIRSFAAGKTRVLVNVDLFGEGFDLPAIECVIMARKTLSFSLYAQQWGRALRLLIDSWLMKQWDDFDVPTRLGHIAASRKPRALIIDQVGNLVHFKGPPTAANDWTLERSDRGRRGSDGAIPLRACLHCCKHYERFHPKCPHCGMRPEPSAEARRDIVQLDGDLALLDPDILLAMEQAAHRAVRTDAEVRQEMIQKFAPAVAVANAVARNAEHREAAQELVRLMQWWAGQQRAEGLDDVSAIQRLFFFRFGVDMLTAQARSRPDMLALSERVRESLTPATISAMMAETVRGQVT